MHEGCRRRWVGLWIAMGLGATLCCTLTSASPANAATVDIPYEMAQAGSSDVVYVLAMCPDSRCTALFRIKPTGTGVTKVAVPVPSAPQAYARLELKFASPRDGVVIAEREHADTSTIFDTVDAAATWTKQTVGAGRFVVGFDATSNAYWAVTAHCPVSDNGRCNHYLLERSPVGRITWTRVAALPVSGNGDVSIAQSGQSLWLSEQTSTLQGLLLRSADGGRHFARLTADQLGCVTAASITATTGSVLWATCPTGLEVSYFRSTNGGKTWVDLPFGETSGTGGAVLDPVAGDVAMFAHGLNGNGLYRVSGASGTVTKVGRVPFDITSDLVFSNERDGIAISESETAYVERLVATSNDGANWHSITL